MTTFGFATVLDEDGGDGTVLSVMAGDRVLPLHDLVSEEERSATPVPDTFDALLDRWDAWVDTVLRALRTYPPDDAGRPWRAASEVTFLPRPHAGPPSTARAPTTATMWRRWGRFRPTRQPLAPSTSWCRGRR
ncbi:hypothetical protein ACFQ2Y_26020 [Streptomyces malaysiensis subsp. malaysiensis]